MVYYLSQALNLIFLCGLETSTCTPLPTTSSSPGPVATLTPNPTAVTTYPPTHPTTTEGMTETTFTPLAPTKPSIPTGDTPPDILAPMIPTPTSSPIPNSTPELTNPIPLDRDSTQSIGTPNPDTGLEVSTIIGIVVAVVTVMSLIIIMVLATAIYGRKAVKTGHFQVTSGEGRRTENISVDTKAYATTPSIKTEANEAYATTPSIPTEANEAYATTSSIPTEANEAYATIPSIPMDLIYASPTEDNDYVIPTLQT